MKLLCYFGKHRWSPWDFYHATYTRMMIITFSSDPNFQPTQRQGTGWIATRTCDRCGKEEKVHQVHEPSAYWKIKNAAEAAR